MEVPLKYRFKIFFVIGALSLVAYFCLVFTGRTSVTTLGKVPLKPNHVLVRIETFSPRFIFRKRVVCYVNGSEYHVVNPNAIDIIWEKGFGHLDIVVTCEGYWPSRVLISEANLKERRSKYSVSFVKKAVYVKSMIRAGNSVHKCDVVAIPFDQSFGPSGLSLQQVYNISFNRHPGVFSKEKYQNIGFYTIVDKNGKFSYWGKGSHSQQIFFRSDSFVFLCKPKLVHNELVCQMPINLIPLPQEGSLCERNGQPANGDIGVQLQGVSQSNGKQKLFTSLTGVTYPDSKGVWRFPSFAYRNVEVCLLLRGADYITHIIRKECLTADKLHRVTLNRKTDVLRRSPGYSLISLGGFKWGVSAIQLCRRSDGSVVGLVNPNRKNTTYTSPVDGLERMYLVPSCNADLLVLTSDSIDSRLPVDLESGRVYYFNIERL